MLFLWAMVTAPLTFAFKEGLWVKDECITGGIIIDARGLSPMPRTADSAASAFSKSKLENNSS